MADNFLEKRYDEVFGKGASIVRSKGPGLESLLRKTRSYRAFDTSYKVNMIQLEAIIRANTMVASARNRQALRFKPVTFDTGSDRVRGLYTLGSALPGLHLPAPGTEPEAFIVICSIVPEDKYIDIDLGISCQSMLLKATEIGLQGIIVCAFDSEKLRCVLDLPYNPLAMIAIGKGTEHIILEEAPSPENTTYYRRDGVHHVPKLQLKDLII